jgi:hypothetical protein
MIKLNVYGFGVQLKSQIEAGNHGGNSVAIVSTSAEQARADLVAFSAELFGGDELVNVSGPTVIVAGALYGGGSTGTGASEPPTCTTAPYVSGGEAVGDTLNCTMGTWTGEPTDYAYQWKGDGATDLGSGPDYTILASDAGTSITCIVTATNAAGSAAAPPSNAVEVAAAATRSHHKK